MKDFEIFMRVVLGDSLFPCSLIRLSFVPMFPSKILKCSLEKLCHTKIVKLFCKSSFFHFQFITSRKKAGSRLGLRADVMNAKRRRSLLCQLANFAKINIQSGFPV